MLNAICLSLSSACAGDCVYCPSDRGARIKQKVMPLDLVKKIVDEIASPEFQAKHNVTHFEVGENGDAFYNRDIIEILRYIQKRLPGVGVGVHTHFQNLNAEIARTIIEEKLIDGIDCNIDGLTEENFFNTKELSLSNFTKNFTNFIALRRELGAILPMSVWVLTLKNYATAVRRNLKIEPVRLKKKDLADYRDDTSDIIKKFKKIIDWRQDRILKVTPIAWAERPAFENAVIDYAKYPCPKFSRVHNTAHIAPDGSWYACCLDSNNEIVFGNVMVSSLAEIHDGEPRKTFLQRIRDRRYGEIGGPCKTVNCCQVLSSPSERVLGKLLGLIPPKLHRYHPRLVRRKLMSMLESLIGAEKKT